MKRFLLRRLEQLAVLSLIGAAFAPSMSTAQSSAPPEETGSRVAPQYAPAFSGQTRAAGPNVRSDYRVVSVAAGLTWPWAIEALPDGRLLVTEKYGALRIVDALGHVSAGVTGMPRISADDAAVKGGLMDVALAPDFIHSHRVYFSYAEPGEGGSDTVVGTGVLDTDALTLTDLRVVWRMGERSASHEHFGARIAFSLDGALLISTGERSPDGGAFGREAVLAARMNAQNLASAGGKVVRINPDGSLPRDNPFRGQLNARGDVWALGFRNPLALAVNPETGAVWTAEHGPKGGDELNHVQAGLNYGWPIVSYGMEYHGEPIGAGITTRDGLEPPAYFWDPNIAPGGMVFYEGSLFAGWKGDLLLAGMKSQRVSRLVIKGDRVVMEEWLPIGSRVRDITVAGDGSIYLITDAQAAEVLHLVPQ